MNAGFRDRITDQFQQNSGFCFHDLCFGFILFMVKPGQMKRAMNQQLDQTLTKRDAGKIGFFFRGIGRYDHISQQKRRNLRELSFLHGKRNYIGRAFMMQVLAVDAFNLGIVDNQERQLMVRIAQVV